jgi:hypothetical protein
MASYPIRAKWYGWDVAPAAVVAPPAGPPGETPPEPTGTGADEPAPAPAPEQVSVRATKKSK